MIEGKAEIILTDEGTGEVESVLECNMVTNAVRDLVSMNPGGLLWNAPLNDRFRIVPLCPNAIGGVLLFSEALPEDPDSYFAPGSAWPVGYASNVPDATEDPLRGSYNPKESGPTPDGYRLVFDFATDRANAEIACVCLTSAQGGLGYEGSVNGASGLTLVFDRVDPGQIPYLVGCSGGTWRSVHPVSATEVEEGSCRFELDSLGLSQDFSPVDARKETYRVTKDYVGGWNDGSCCCLDGDDTYVIRCKQGSGSVSLCRIAAGPDGVRAASETVVEIEGASLERSALKALAVARRKLFAVASDRASVYRVDLDNPADVARIPLPEKIVLGNGQDYGVSQPFQNGMVRGRGFAITSDGSVRKATEPGTFPTAYRHGPYYIKSTYVANRGDTVEVGVSNTYLATINNLAAPVTKTAEKTMKVVYTLTEKA